MRLTIVAVGRVRTGPVVALCEDYVRRLPWSVDLHEIEVKQADAAIQRRREGERLMAALPDRAFVVALDAGGKALDSAGLAEQLAAWRDQGRRELAFVIGGADGLDEAVLGRADFVLSLGPMTWPHLLVRVMLTEQLYRASSILSGHPYHRA